MKKLIINNSSWTLLKDYIVFDIDKNEITESGKINLENTQGVNQFIERLKSNDVKDFEFKGPSPKEEVSINFTKRFK